MAVLRLLFAWAVAAALPLPHPAQLVRGWHALHYYSLVGATDGDAQHHGLLFFGVLPSRVQKPGDVLALHS